MRRAVWLAGGLAICLGLATPLEAQTGPEVHRKGDGMPSASDALGPGDEWLSWTEDELVSRTIHTPVKLKGLRGVEAEARLALKPLMGRAADQLRATLAALAAGEIDSETARRWVEDALREYRSTIDGLLAVR